MTNDNANIQEVNILPTTKQDNSELLSFIVHLRFEKQLAKSEVARTVGMTEEELDAFYQANAHNLSQESKKIIQSVKTTKLESLSNQSMSIIQDSLSILNNLVQSVKFLPANKLSEKQVAMVESALNTATRTYQSIENTLLKTKLVDSVQNKQTTTANEPTFGDSAHNVVDIHEAIVALPNRPTSQNAKSKQSDAKVPGDTPPPDTFTPLSSPDVSTSDLIVELRRRQSGLKSATPELIGILPDEDPPEDPEFAPVFV